MTYFEVEKREYVLWKYRGWGEQVNVSMKSFYQLDFLSSLFCHVRLSPHFLPSSITTYEICIHIRAKSGSWFSTFPSANYYYSRVNYWKSSKRNDSSTIKFLLESFRVTVSATRQYAVFPIILMYGVRLSSAGYLILKNGFQNRICGLVTAVRYELCA